LNILVTGGSGFIGHYVIKRLLQLEHNVTIITRSGITVHNQITVIEGDLNSISGIRQRIIDFQPDIVVYLAWQGIPNFSIKMCQENLCMAMNFFDQVLDGTNCKKVIVSGSCFEYGKKHGNCKESDQVNINSYFTWAKYALYLYLSIKCVEKDVTLNWFRIFYVYGPGQREGSLIPTLIKSIVKSKTPLVNTPMNENDFVYVDDVAEAIVKACNREIKSGVYNLGSGRSTSIFNVCKIVEKQLKGTSHLSEKVKNKGSEDKPLKFWSDNEKSSINFGWDPKVNIIKGIELYLND